MFDTTVHKHTSTVTPVTRVVEKTISPDQVTKMYDQIAEEIRKATVKKIIIKSNIVEGVILVVKDANSCDQIVTMRYIVNGEEFICEYRDSEMEKRFSHLDEGLIFKFFDYLKEDIFSNLMGRIDRSKIQILTNN